MTQNRNIMSQLGRVENARRRLADEIADNDRTGARDAIVECRAMLGELSAAIDQHESEVKKDIATHHLALTEDM